MNHPTSANLHPAIALNQHQHHNQHHNHNPASQTFQTSTYNHGNRNNPDSSIPIPAPLFDSSHSHSAPELYFQEPPPSNSHSFSPSSPRQHGLGPGYNPVATHQAPPAAAASAQQQWTSLRIENLSSDTTVETLLAKFVPRDRPGIWIRSLAPAVDSEDTAHGELTATISWAPPEGVAQARGGGTDDTNVRLPEVLDDEIDVDAEFYGFTPLNWAREPVGADIIAVSGFNHALDSWSSTPKHNWLRDSLPKDISNVRVMIYGYDFVVDEEASKTCLADIVRDFKQRLLTLHKRRGGHNSYPIVLVGHSLGCLVIKKTLVELYAAHPTLRPFTVQCLVLLAPPHRGLSLTALSTLVTPRPSQDIIDELGERSTELKSLNEAFMDIASNLKILTCYERVKTATMNEHPDGTFTRTGRLELLVSIECAVLRISEEQRTPGDGDHFQIAKLKKSQAGNYTTIKAFITQHLTRPIVLSISSQSRTSSVSDAGASPNMGVQSSTAIFNSPDPFQGVQDRRSVSFMPLPDPARAPVHELQQPTVPKIEEAPEQTPRRHMPNTPGVSYHLIPPMYKDRIHVDSRPHSSSSRSPPSTGDSSNMLPPQPGPPPARPLPPLPLPQPYMPILASSALDVIMPDRPYPVEAELAPEGSRGSPPIAELEGDEGVERSELPTDGGKVRAASVDSGSSSKPSTVRRPSGLGRFMPRRSSNKTPQYSGPPPAELFVAVREKDLTRIQDLIKAGCDVNAKDPDNSDRTALHLATEMGDVSLVSLLLRHQPKLDARTTDRRTPLHICAEQGHAYIATQLLDKGANADAQTADQDSALHIATGRGHVDVVQALVRARINLQAKDGEGRTAKMIAASKELANIVRELDKAANKKAEGVFFPGLQ